jgi:hypothetical protein
MPIDAELMQELEGVRARTHAIAREHDRAVAILAAKRAELVLARSEAAELTRQCSELLARTEVEVREIIRAMKDFDRASQIESAAKESWRKLQSRMQGAEVTAQNLTTICEDLSAKRDQLASALKRSSIDLAAAFERVRAAPMLPAVGTPNEAATAEYLDGLNPSPAAAPVYAPPAPPYLCQSSAPGIRPSKSVVMLTASRVPRQLSPKSLSPPKQRTHSTYRGMSLCSAWILLLLVAAGVLVKSCVA